MKFIFYFLLLIEFLLMLFTGNLALFVIFAFTLLFPFAYIVFISIVKPEFTISFSMPKNVRKEEQTKCSLILNNKRKILYPNVKLTLNIKNPITKEQSVLKFDNSVLPKGSVKNSFDFKSSFCGTVSFSVESIKVYDLFGIAFRKIECKKCDYITVLPEIFTTDFSSEYFDSNNFDELETEKIGNDLYNISYMREYQKGDSIKRIHHKLSAKLDELIVKQGVENEQKKARIVFDSFLNKELTAKQADKKAEEFISKCFAFVENNVKLEILVYINGKITTFEIETEDDLYSAVPEILKVEFVVGKSVFN